MFKIRNCSDFENVPKLLRFLKCNVFEIENRKDMRRMKKPYRSLTILATLGRSCALATRKQPRWARTIMKTTQAIWRARLA